MGLSTYSLLKNAKIENRVEIKGDLLLKMQKILLQALKDFARVCDKYNFYYSLCGGSALGAVRHKGFIPWDDDVDVFMVRSEYNQFLEIFEKELGDKYYIHSLETTPEIGMPICQMMVRGTVLKSCTCPDCKESGVYIDICVLENAPDNMILRKIHGVGSLFYGFCVSCSRFYNNRESLLTIYKDSDKEVVKTIKQKVLIGKLLSFHSMSTWSKHYVWWNSIYKNEKSKYVVCPTGIKHYFSEIFPREKYCVTKMIDFEDTQVKVMKDVEWALSRSYGNYMEVPPKDKRETHFVLDIKI